MLTAYFVRHGESESNVGLPTADYTEIALTAKGIEQAERLVDSITEQPTIIAMSSHKRARQTTRPFLLRFPTVPIEVWPVYEFSYLDLPSHVATTIDERKELTAAYWEKSDPFYIHGRDAESFAAFIERVQYVLDKLKELTDGCFIIFTHEQFTHAVQWLLLRDRTEVTSGTMKQYRSFLTSFAMPNGSYIKIRFNDGEIWMSTIISP